MILSSASLLSSIGRPPTIVALTITSDWLIGRSLITQMSSGSPSPILRIGHQRPHAIAAIGAWDESVQSGAER